MPAREGPTPEGALDALVADMALDGRRVGLAVSGGGDSTALLHVAAAARRRLDLVAATVDHGLRPEAAEEARAVAGACAALGIPHETLWWDGWDGRGNLQARARDARRALLAEWARRQGAEAVLLAHTADDQAETVLINLARGSGVDGLAGMQGGLLVDGTWFLRPFLGVGRDDLRAWLRARGIGWADDPSNDDPRFARARARAMMGHLASLGLTRDRLVRTAGHMAAARTILDLHAVEEARAVRVEGGALLLPRRVLDGVEHSDTQARLLAAAVMWVGGRDVRPRWEALRRLARAVAAGRRATLGGCLVALDGEDVRVAPEPGRAAPRGGAWDFGVFLGAHEHDG